MKKWYNLKYILVNGANHVPAISIILKNCHILLYVGTQKTKYYKNFKSLWEGILDLLYKFE